MKLKESDSIIALNGQPVFFFDDFKARVASLKGQPVRISVVRDNQIAVLSGTVSKDGTIGFKPYFGPRHFKFVHIGYNPFQAVGKGLSYTFDQFGSYIDQFKLIFTSPEVKLSKSLGGIGTFAKIFPEEFTWHGFLGLVALVSIVLAFMNLLPIPGLDGGYVIFLLYELVTRRKVSDKVMEVSTSIGLVLLLALMLYANGLDVFRAWFGK
jgi:regulator of sigma E protease